MYINIKSLLYYHSYFPKFSPSSIVSGNSQFIVSGNNKQRPAPINCPTPNMTGGNQG